MIQIDIEMPKTCNDCPCSYLTEGCYSDYCQINGQDFNEETAENYGIYKRQKWCPLIEIKEDKQ